MTSGTGAPAPTYHSFLLRLWRESEQGGWRASLENVTTGERQGFPDLASLFAFLHAKCHQATVHGRETTDGQS
jgi:hypothetical protein